MTAAGQEQQVREDQRLIDEPRAECMAFKVIDRDQRLSRREREAFADEETDHYSPDKAGSGCGGDCINFPDADVSLMQHLADQTGQDLNMRACRDFGHNAAERAMRVVLADDCLRQDLSVATDQCHGAVIARGFKGKNKSHPTRPLPETPALR